MTAQWTARALGVLGLVLAALPWGAQEPPPEPAVTRPELRRELLEMVREDQEVRNELLAKPGDGEVQARMASEDARRTGRVLAILREHGWPTTAEVGAEGCGAVWILLQHSAPGVLKACLPLMRKAVRKGDLEAGLLATSIDRVRVGEGKRQLYGTQFEERDGTWGPCPIEDEARLDARREEMGLGPFEEYLKLIEQVYGAPGGGEGP